MSNFDRTTVKVEADVRTDRQKGGGAALGDFRRCGVDAENSDIAKQDFK